MNSAAGGEAHSMSHRKKCVRRTRLVSLVHDGEVEGGRACYAQHSHLRVARVAVRASGSQLLVCDVPAGRLCVAPHGGQRTPMQATRARRPGRHALLGRVGGVGC